MTQEKYESLKKSYVEFITDIIKDFGGLPPAVTVLGIRKDDNKETVIHVPIPDFLMNSDDGKDEFIDNVVPEIATKVKKEFDIECVAWASEAWMRSIPKDETTTEPGIPTNWKSFPKKEVLIITFESEEKNEVIVMEIVRLGQQVNSEGQLTEHVELKPVPDMGKVPDKVEGRFSGLYKKFKTV